MEENIVLEDVLKKMNLRERIIVRVFRRTFNKATNNVRIVMVNNFLK